MRQPSTKNPIAIGDLMFTTKKQIHEYGVTSVKNALITSSKKLENFNFWQDLLNLSDFDRHRNISNYLKTVKCIEAYAEYRDKGEGVFLVTENKKKIDFSWKKAITSPSPLQIFTEVLRDTVRNDVCLWKEMKKEQSRFPFIRCPITKQIIDIDNTDVDHVSPQFHEIRNMFVKEFLVDLNKLNYTFYGIDSFRTNCLSRHIKSPNDWIEKEFRAFHAQVTDIKNPQSKHLRLASKKGNQNRKWYEHTVSNTVKF